MGGVESRVYSTLGGTTRCGVFLRQENVEPETMGGYLPVTGVETRIRQNTNETKRDDIV